MKSLTIEAAKELLASYGLSDNTDTILRSKSAVLMTIESLEFLNQLIFPYHRDTVLITPKGAWGGRHYTVEDVVDFYLKTELSFEQLGADPGLADHEQAWYRFCIPLADSFSFEKMGPILVRPALWAEKRQCPGSLFRLLDGLHRSLVLSALCAKKNIMFQPIQAIVVS